MLGQSQQRWLVMLIVPVVLLFSGCAEQPRRTLQFQLPGDGLQSSLVWPDPPSPPRIAYIGDLTGEGNFETNQDRSKSGFIRFIEFLAGVGFDKEVPKVLRRPQSGVTDEQGRIFVTDVGSSAVFVFDELNGTMAIWGEVTKGQAFISPIGITLGPDNTIMVADSELGSVVVLDRDTGQLQRHFGLGILKRPTGIVRAPDLQLTFVADTQEHNIKVFDDQGTLVELIGQKGSELGEFNAPVYLAYQAGQLFVTDVLNARVQIFDVEGEAHQIIGQRGLFVGNLTRPKGVALDSDGNLYIIESYYDHLLVYNQQGRLLLPIGGAGHEAGRFFLPAGVWSDHQDRIFVADMLNGRIAVFQYLGNPE